MMISVGYQRTGLAAYSYEKATNAGSSSWDALAPVSAKFIA